MNELDYPDVDLDPAGSLGLRQVKAWERIATALEQLVLNQLPSEGHPLNATQKFVSTKQWAPAELPPDELPPPPIAPVSVAPSASQQAFRESRDLPPEPFVNLANWTCPVHHTRKVVPAGISKGTGKSYKSFVSCEERDCKHVADWCRVEGCADAPPPRR